MRTKHRPLAVLLTLACCASRANALSQAVERLIQNADSVEQLVPRLPESFRRNFTFVYDSRSPFKGSISPASPRAILFSKDGREILTFTSARDRPGYDILETMSFDDIRARFAFKAYVLPAALRRGQRLSADQQDCARCHGVDPRPIFDSYPLWPGFYGSVQDSFPGNAVGQRELKNYLDFQRQGARRGVFKALVYAEDSPVAPYLDPKLYDPKERTGDLKLFRFLPNTRLGMALTELNRQRLWRKLAATPNYPSRVHSWLRRLLECDGRPLSPVAEIADQVRAENQARLRRLGVDPQDPKERVNDMQEGLFLSSLTEIRQMAQEAGLSQADWSMALEANSNSYFDGILSSAQAGFNFYLKEDWIFEILRDLQNRDDRFKPYFQAQAVYAWLGLPFGHRLDLVRARRACAAL